jgi:hypothetical protein
MRRPVGLLPRSRRRRYARRTDSEAVRNCICRSPIPRPPTNPAFAAQLSKLHLACHICSLSRGKRMTFSHPLARSASVFTARSSDGDGYRVLAIVTTLELDPKSADYKKPFVERLSKAATDYLGSSNEAAAFVLMNRPKDWADCSARMRREQSRAKDNKNKS